MMRGLDHISHAVHDLDAAADAYRALGFTVGARNKHDWGTHNCIVQMPGFFIELLTVAEPEKIPPHTARTFSFGAFHRDYLASHEGLAMLLLGTGDAKADNAEWHAAGIGAFDVFDFGREGKRPDGSTIKLAFTLAFATDLRAPDVGLAACQHHYPENFWNTEFQQHSNGVQGLAGIIMTADQPVQHRDFLAAYTGAAVRDDGDGFAIDLPNGALAVMTPAAFADAFGQPAPVTGTGPRFTALRFKSAKPRPAAAILGATLLFEP